MYNIFIHVYTYTYIYMYIYIFSNIYTWYMYIYIYLPVWWTGGVSRRRRDFAPRARRAAIRAARYSPTVLVRRDYYHTNEHVFIRSARPLRYSTLYSHSAGNMCKRHLFAAMYACLAPYCRRSGVLQLWASVYVVPRNAQLRLLHPAISHRPEKLRMGALVLIRHE